MTRSTILLLTILVSACTAAPADEGGISKSDARAQAGKADSPFDFCAELDWYGDGVCDDFCLNPDPDCDGNQYCYADADCAAGEACNAADVCLSPCEPGAICPAVCAGFCVEAPPVDTCWGAWTDQFGTCRTPADGVYPDSCCAGDMCGGFANIPCDSDEWCSFGAPPSDAAADLSGVCMPRPQACIEIFAPVCGADGQTYSNECFAHMAGVDVASEGECAAGACDQRPLSACDNGDGECEVQSFGCEQPLCETQADGTELCFPCDPVAICVPAEPVPTMCGGFANIPCAGADEWCSFGDVPTGASADMSGICLPRPEACIQLFAPVCGRDGQTYSNACHANMAGVDAVAEGACL